MKNMKSKNNMFKNRTGETNYNKWGERMTIIEYKNNPKIILTIILKFMISFEITSIEFENINKLKVKSKQHKFIPQKKESNENKLSTFSFNSSNSSSFKILFIIKLSLFYISFLCI